MPRAGKPRSHSACSSTSLMAMIVWMGAWLMQSSEGANLSVLSQPQMSHGDVDADVEMVNGSPEPKTTITLDNTNDNGDSDFEEDLMIVEVDPDSEDDEAGFNNVAVIGSVPERPQGYPRSEAHMHMQRRGRGETSTQSFNNMLLVSTRDGTLHAVNTRNLYEWKILWSKTGDPLATSSVDPQEFVVVADLKDLSLYEQQRGTIVEFSKTIPQLVGLYGRYKKDDYTFFFGKEDATYERDLLSGELVQRLSAKDNFYSTDAAARSEFTISYARTDYNIRAYRTDQETRRTDTVVDLRVAKYTPTSAYGNQDRVVNSDDNGKPIVKPNAEEIFVQGNDEKSWIYLLGDETPKMEFDSPVIAIYEIGIDGELHERPFKCRAHQMYFTDTGFKHVDWETQPRLTQQDVHLLTDESAGITPVLPKFEIAFNAQTQGYISEMRDSDFNVVPGMPYRENNFSLVWIIYLILGTSAILKVLWDYVLKRRDNGRIVLPDGSIRVGQLEVKRTSLGRGSHGEVLVGSFEHREIAIKKIELAHCNIADNEIELLRKFSNHPNVVRYHCTAKCNQYIYIGIELCITSLLKVVEMPEERLRDDGLGELMPLRSTDERRRLIREFLEGLEYLHSKRIVHRDIKPQNILISEEFSAKIADFGLSTHLSSHGENFGTVTVGTSGWRAPEILIAIEAGAGLDDLTSAIDIFSAGCVVHFTLTGQHPFRDEDLRNHNILTKNSTVNAGDEIANDLIRKMIGNRYKNRPRVAVVLKHPYFWDAKRRVGFLGDVSNRLKSEQLGSALLARVEVGSTKIIGKNTTWMAKLGGVLQKDLRNFRTYDHESLVDLLRAIRNKSNHEFEMPEELKKEFANDGGLMNYFQRRFPKLLMHLHNNLKSELEAEEFWRKGQYS